MGLFQVEIEVLPADGGSPRAQSVLGREGTVLTFLAPDQSPQLLGAQALEPFALGVDPLGKRLVPVDAYLA